MAGFHFKLTTHHLKGENIRILARGAQPTRGDYSNPHTGVFQPRRVVGLDFKPPTQHPKGGNITTPARGVSLSQGGQFQLPQGSVQLPRVVGFDFKPTTHPRKWESITSLTRVFNSQGWWALILSPPPTTPRGNHPNPRKGVSQLPRGDNSKPRKGGGHRF